MGLLAFFIAVLAIVAIVQLQRRVRELEADVRELVSASRTAVQAESRERAEAYRSTRARRSAPVSEEPARATPVARPASVTEAAQPAGPFRPVTERSEARTVVPPAAAEASAASEWWRKVEPQLMENWTGILGAVVLVAGVTFVGGYTGLRLSPFYRSLMVAGAGMVLFTGAFVLGRRDSWDPLAKCLRSSGAAVVLLACFGSSAIPGLTWIEGLAPALAVLLIGIGVNMGVAYRADEQVFASLHIVLSLVPLLIVPQSTTTLVVASIVAGTGVRLAWRPSWHLQILVTLSAYAAFHAVWFAQVIDLSPTPLSRFAGGAAAAFVCALVAARQYRTHATEAATTLDVVVHVANWVFIGIALAAYIGDGSLRGIVLMAVAAAIYVLGMRARTAGARRLYLSDTLVAEGLALWGLVALQAYVFHWLLIPALAFAMAALFYRLGVTAGEPLLERCGLHALRITGAAVVLSGLVTLDPYGVLGRQHAVVLFATAAFAASYHMYLFRRSGAGQPTGPGPEGEVSSPASGALVPALVAGLLALIGSVDLYGAGWMTLAGIQAGLLFLVGARRVRSASLALGAFAVLVPMYLLAWVDLLGQHPLPMSEQMSTHLAALLLGGLLAAWLAAPERVGAVYREVAAYALGLTLIVASYTLAQPVSPYLPSVVWLGLSLVALEVSARSGAMAGPVLGVGWTCLFFFALAYLLLVIPSTEALGIASIRVWMTLLSLLALGRWWTFRGSPALEELAAWRSTQPLALEAMVLVVVTLVVAEVDAGWRPFAWAAMAALGAGALGRSPATSRLRLYSVVFFWLATYELILMVARSQPSGDAPLLRPEVMGALAITAQIAYLAVLSRRLGLTDVEFPAAISGLRESASAIAASLPGLLYYPFFFGVALFLYRQFDAALLTLLWAVEAFSIFAVSLILRESHFRYVALTALGAVLIRLLVFDLSQSNLGIRGLIFIGVGALMLGMNSLYSRYKDRYA